jgi:hypothetical protein
MSTKLHIEDTDAMTAIHARMHERLVRSIPMNFHDENNLNDLLIPGQDEAYACGRKRGAEEALAAAQVEEDGTPAEILASRLITAWGDTHGKPIPWAKAVEISFIITKFSEAERQRLLALDGEFN